MYSTGRADICMTLFYSLLFIAIHAVENEYFWEVSHVKLVKLTIVKLVKLTIVKLVKLTIEGVDQLLESFLIV